MAHRILVVRLSSLGDVVLTAPVYKNLKAHWPDAKVCVLVKPQFRAVLEGNPNVDEVIAYHGLRQALGEIRKRQFTHLLDLHSTWRTFWIRYLSATPQVAVYRKNALARRLFVLFRLSSPALARHTLDRYLESLRCWGVPVRTRELSLGDYGASAEAPPKAARVLLTQTSFLGDCLLTLPLARKIKETLPGCSLSVLTRPKTAEIFRRSRWVDEVILDDKRGAHSGLKGLWALSKDLRQRGFDLGLVAHRSLRSALLAWLARIPQRIGFSSSAGWFLFHRTVYFPWGMPELERNLALLLPLKSDLKAAAEDSLYLEGAEDPPDAAEAVQNRLTRDGISPSDLVIGFHPGSAWPTKRWLSERYARLAERLVRGAGARVILLGGPEDLELSRRIAESAGVETFDWTGHTTLVELTLLMRRLRLLVTNDSGPMHVAAASGVPVLALFGPTTRELGFFPYGSGHRVLEKDLSCRPCGLHGSSSCPEGHFLCMRLITVEEVFRNAVEMLQHSMRPTGAAAS